MKSICQNKTKNDCAKYSLAKLFLYMSFVNMCADNKGIITFQQFRSQLVSDLVCFLWRNFAGLKGLPELISNHFIVNLPAGIGDVRIAREQKLMISGFRGAGI